MGEVSLGAKNNNSDLSLGMQASKLFCD